MLLSTERRPNRLAFKIIHRFCCISPVALPMFVCAGCFFLLGTATTVFSSLASSVLPAGALPLTRIVASSCYVGTVCSLEAALFGVVKGSLRRSCSKKDDEVLSSSISYV